MYGQTPGIRVTSNVILCRPPQLPERHHNVMEDCRNNKGILNQHTDCFWVGSSAAKIQKTRCIHWKQINIVQKILGICEFKKITDLLPVTEPVTNCNSIRNVWECSFGLHLSMSIVSCIIRSCICCYYCIVHANLHPTWVYSATHGLGIFFFSLDLISFFHFIPLCLSEE